MYFEKKKIKQIEMLCIEDLVPENHLLGEIDRAISFDFIYDLVRELYCADNGRLSIDPVALFKIVLIPRGKAFSRGVGMIAAVVKL